jgi:hypothetical protein
MRADDDDAIGIAAALDAEHVDDLHPVRRARAGEATTDPLHREATAATAPDRLELRRRPFARRADAALRVGGRGERVARPESDHRLHVGFQALRRRGGKGGRSGGEEERDHGVR